MCQSLGSQGCIESLQKDLTDIQCAIVDVFSANGPLHVYSWKFPDKLACNVDLDLEHYNFVNGEDEFNQHVHIVLLELVIDRLLLLLQASDAYVEELSSNKRNQQTDQKGCMSIGLVVKKYWRDLLQFANMKMCKESELETVMSSCDDDLPSTCAHDISRSASTICLPAYDDPLSDTHVLACNPKIDTHNVGCQTNESPSAFCGVCPQAQSAIRKTGHVLVELLQGEGLPSSLLPLLDTVGQMAVGDVPQWASEQLRDMRRLTKHIQDVRDTVEPLKMKLTAAEADREKIGAEMERAQKDLQEEVEKQKSISLQLEMASQKAQTIMKETEHRLSKEYQQLKREYESLKKSYSDLMEEVATQKDRLQDLECERNKSLDKLKTLHLKEETCSKLQERIEEFESQLCEAHLLLEKEEAKYHSACLHQESMEKKQKSLLQRVEALDEECEELQKQLGEREERELNLHNQLQQVSQQNENLRAQLTSQQDHCSELQSEKQTLQTQIEHFQGSVAELKESVKSFKDKERLLVAFPELSPLAHAQPKSTGNVLLDMEQQLQANYIRIGVLEKENASLHGSLVKLRKSTPNQQESSPLQINSSSPASPPVKQMDYLTQMQRSPFSRQNYRAPWLGNSDRGDRRGCMSSRAADCLSPLSSPSIFIQALHPNISSTGAIAQTRNTPKTSALPQNRSLKQRKK
ncbi:coiled-coil domain-containing protein 157 [Syngnathus typhle]|uniref:coiled-coil domain-containing protein 157 n=1 Tax=Syngnathus typhle TaxID=161592 RepID=UPI002A6B23F1|nr:coiled-coil domain-containing protein 157 [Syngnathus typhle]